MTGSPKLALASAASADVLMRFTPGWVAPDAVPIEPGMRVVVGVHTQRGIAWTVCLVRSVLDGRGWAELQSMPQEIEVIRGERFEVPPECVALVYQPAAPAAYH